MIISKKRNTIVTFAVLFFVLLVSYGQTLRMNFWRDDYTMLFKLQHPLEKASHFGDNGLVGSGPYQFILLPHALFFPIFKLNPTGYFAVGLVLYAGAMLALYVFVRELLKSRKAAIFAALAFAAGYIASDGLFRIINSWQNSYGQILALLTFAAYIKFLNGRGFKYYFLALGFYLASIEFVYVRSHSLIMVVAALDILFGLLPNIKKGLPAFIVRQIPFWLLFKFWYLQDSQLGGSGLKERFVSIFINHNFGEITPMFANIGNVIFPDSLQARTISFITKLVLRGEPPAGQIFWMNILMFVGFVLAVLFLAKLSRLSKKYYIPTCVLLFLVLILNLQFYSKSYYWYKDIQTIVAGLIGMESFVLSVFLFMSFWNRNRKIGTAILFGWLTVASQVFGYYILYKDAILESTHRYLSDAFLGYCVLMAGAASMFMSKKVKARSKYVGYFSVIGLSLLLLANLKLNVNSQLKFVNEVSIPSKMFYQQLKNFVPAIAKGSLLYFDIQNESFYQHQFDEFFSVGSMPNSTAVAVYYNIDRYDFFLTSNYDEVLAKIANKEINIAQIYSFYYGADGFKNTTSDFRDLLLDGGKSINVVSSKVEFQNKFVLEKKSNALTPLLLTMDIYPVPLLNKLGEAKPGNLLYSLDDKLNLIDYLKGRNNYYKISKAIALSYWQYQRVENLLDNDVTTPWRGDRLYWHDNQKDAVTIDLGFNKKISKIMWTNWNRYLTPTSYFFETSLDGNAWKMVKKVENSQERKDGEVVIEDFPATLARYVRMSISKTVSDDSPAISEIEVVEDKYSKADILNREGFVKNPFAGTTERNGLITIYKAFAPLAEVVVSIDTDKGKLSDTLHIPVNLGERAVYQGVIPAYGSSIENLTLEVRSIPTQLTLYNLSLRNMSFTELEERNLIKNFKE